MLSFSDLVQYAQNAGFSGNSANTIAAIAMAESSGNPYAINPNDPGGSYGLTQINEGAWGIGAENTLGNPQEAFNQAYAVSNGGTNFSPWSTYTNGQYAQYLPQNSSATGTPDSSNSSGSCGYLIPAFPSFGFPGVTDPTCDGTTSSLSGLSTLIQNASKFLGDLTQGATWERVGVIVIGIILLLVAGWSLATNGFEGTVRTVTK